MRLFGRFMLAASVALTLATGAASGQEKKLRLGTEGPPFSYASADGMLGGFDIDLGKALCAENAGVVTYSDHGYSWGKVLATAHLRLPFTSLGTDIDGKPTRAVVAPMPFFDPEGIRLRG
ncbi:hypothetical protein [Mesorhizobium sp. Cs1299R1N3]|uniref:hypothetical protein n=1 Tax=Mesorhizobium sp. Cs1299R1N3 TaxID=3015173 RepID=UPI003FA596FB